MLSLCFEIVCSFPGRLHTYFRFSIAFIHCMSHFNGLGALKALLIIGTNYRKIDNTLYRYCTGRVTRTCIPTPVIRSRLTQ